MVWGVCIFFTCVTLATDFIIVARVQHFLNDNRFMYRRARISSADIGWTVLLDIQISSKRYRRVLCWIVGCKHFAISMLIIS